MPEKALTSRRGGEGIHSAKLAAMGDFGLDLLEFCVDYRAG
jgi:hypothetical protein